MNVCGDTIRTLAPYQSDTAVAYSLSPNLDRINETKRLVPYTPSSSYINSLTSRQARSVVFGMRDTCYRFMPPYEDAPKVCMEEEDRGLYELRIADSPCSARVCDGEETPAGVEAVLNKMFEEYETFAAQRMGIPEIDRQRGSFLLPLGETSFSVRPFNGKLPYLAETITRHVNGQREDFYSLLLEEGGSPFIEIFDSSYYDSQCELLPLEGTVLSALFRS